MKFTLTYDGDLASSGNKSKPVEASNIRNEFHNQLADLWDSNVVFRQLARTARFARHRAPGALASPPQLPDYNDPIPPLIEEAVDLCAPIRVPNVGGFIPIVRQSLYLMCAVDILFLRHEQPMSLMRQGGDLDGRLKTLFDALKMPDPRNPVYNRALPSEDPLYVVLEDDSLISDFSVRSGMLLGRGSKMHHRVRLTIDITIKVLRVFDPNQCLLGG